MTRFAGSAAAVPTVGVTLIVVPAGVPCRPTQLVPVQVGIFDDFMPEADIIAECPVTPNELRRDLRGRVLRVRRLLEPRDSAG